MHDIPMQKEDTIETIRKKFERLSGVLDERGRRVWATVEAEALGYGGQGIVAKATGLSRATLHREGVEQERDQPPAILTGFGERAAVGKGPSSKGPGCCWRWKLWLSRRLGAIRKARFAGLAVALANWQTRWRPKAIGSATRRWRPCWTA